jgi:hypothetical protein
LVLTKEPECGVFSGRELVEGQQMLGGSQGGGGALQPALANSAEFLLCIYAENPSVDLSCLLPSATPLPASG